MWGPPGWPCALAVATVALPPAPWARAVQCWRAPIPAAAAEVMAAGVSRRSTGRLQVAVPAWPRSSAHAATVTFREFPRQRANGAYGNSARERGTAPPQAPDIGHAGSC